MMQRKIRIIEYSSEPFKDRKEAGRLLGSQLKDLAGKSPIVLGVLRGGIVVAYEIAKFLNAGLDLMLARKIGAPFNPEFAIGAVSEDGQIFINQNLAGTISLDDDYIAKEKNRQLLEISARIEKFRKLCPKIQLRDKIAVLVDDGVATGATMQAALWSCKKEKPGRLIAALPVAPEETLGRLADDSDEVICLRVPQFFSAVGQFYNNFEQVDDTEVLSILKLIKK